MGLHRGRSHAAWIAREVGQPNRNQGTTIDAYPPR
jgi:hypothetical protein